MIVLTSHKSNRGDSFKRQQEGWRHAYAHAPSVRERYPDVAQLIVHLTFVDARAMGRYSAQMHSFSPSAKGFFAIPCPRTLCLGGGFDLHQVVEQMIAAKQDSACGSLVCAGSTDPAHPRAGACRLELTYEIRVEYGALVTHRAGALSPV
jgi:hypothetical protein